MNKINGIETNEFVFEAVVKIIESIIKLASNSGGKLYSDYLRNVIIPRLNGFCVCDYSTLRFSFANEIDADEMIKKMKELYPAFILSIDMGNLKCYRLYINQLNIAEIHIAYNQEPDLDINTLYHYYKYNSPIIYDSIDGCEYWTDIKKSTLVDKIINKRASILKSFVDVFNTYNTIKQQRAIDGWNTLINKGWVLNYEDLTFDKEITLEWFLNQINGNLLQAFRDKQALFEQCGAERDLLLKQCLVKYNNQVTKLCQVDDKNINRLTTNQTLKDLLIDMLINQIDQ